VINWLGRWCRDEPVKRITRSGRACYASGHKLLPLSRMSTATKPYLTPNPYALPMRAVDQEQLGLGFRPHGCGGRKRSFLIAETWRSSAVGVAGCFSPQELVTSAETPTCSYHP
jgi:hypothetical protein